MVTPRTAPDAQPSPFPARSQSATQIIHGIETSATSISFSDKIMITLAQSGRINHWIQVPLARSNPLEAISIPRPPTHYDSEPDSSLLPLTDLTATTILGGTKQEAELTGQTLATTLATAVLMRNGEEHRPLVLGLGLVKPEVSRADFDALVGLCLDVI